MNHRDLVGFKIEELARCMRKAVCRGAQKAGYDKDAIKHGFIIGFLIHNVQEGKIVCQRDIEKAFHMPKSSATDLLQYYEKEGMINRVPLENDARIKQIVLSDKGTEFAEATKSQIEDVEKFMVKDIPKEELEVFLSVLGRMKENAMTYMVDEDNKEEKKLD